MLFKKIKNIFQNISFYNEKYVDRVANEFFKSL